MYCDHLKLKVLLGEQPKLRYGYLLNFNSISHRVRYGSLLLFFPIVINSLVQSTIKCLTPVYRGYAQHSNRMLAARFPQNAPTH